MQNFRFLIEYNREELYIAYVVYIDTRIANLNILVLRRPLFSFTQRVLSYHRRFYLTVDKVKNIVNRKNILHDIASN